MGLVVKRLHCFFAQVAARLAIHKSLSKSQDSFDLFSNLSMCLIRANARAILRRVYNCNCLCLMCIFIIVIFRKQVKKKNLYVQLHVSLTIWECLFSNERAVLSKLHCLGPHTYGVLSVWFKRGQLSTGDVPSHVMYAFTSIMWSVADLINSDNAVCILWWLPR